MIIGKEGGDQRIKKDTRRVSITSMTFFYTLLDIMQIIRLYKEV